MTTTDTADRPEYSWFIDYSDGKAIGEQIKAAYYAPSTDGSFLEFKDRDHKVVLAVRTIEVRSIRRGLDQ